ncbi:MAG TPA: hypothetical protein VD794_11635 [Flavisolibacter sp.]|nr:hypothetical protein [Flavisolibacter sp.]
MRTTPYCCNGGSIPVTSYNNSNQPLIFSETNGTRTTTTGSNTCSVRRNS